MKENQPETQFLKEPDLIPTSTQVTNSTKSWLKTSKATIATVAREKPSIPTRNQVDQLVLKVNLEAKLGHIKEKMILRVSLVSRIWQDLMKMIPR